MTANAVIEDHGLLQGLGDDDHPQYFLLAGRAGGQVAYGGTAITDSLDLYPNTQSPPVSFATDGFLNVHGRFKFLGFSDLTGTPGINYQLMFHGETVDCSGQGSIIPQGFWYQPRFDFNTAQTFGGAATFQDGSIWRESAFITGTHNTFSLGSYLGGPRYQIGHAGIGKPPSGLYGFNSTPAADLIGGTSLTMPVMAGYSTNFPFPLQTFLGLQPLRNGVVCTRYSHYKAYSNIPNALTLQGGSLITTEVGLDLQNLSRGTTSISVFSDALGAYMDHAGLITYTAGVLRLGTTAATGHGLGAGDVLIGADLEVDGVSYFDASVLQSKSASVAQNVQTIYNYTPTGASVGSVTGWRSELNLNGSSNAPDDLSGISAFVNAVFTYDTGTISDVAAIRAAFSMANLGTGATITEAATFRATANSFLMGFTVNRYAGMWIENLDATGVTNLHPIYQIGPNGLNYFGTKTQIEQKESGEFGLEVFRNIAEAGSKPLLSFYEENASGTQPLLSLRNDGSGAHLVTGATNEDLEINPNGTGLTRMLGGARVDSADAIYFGSPTVDGSWRIIRSGNDFAFERRESSSWVEKGAFTAV